MIKKLNNKGMTLVEVVVCFALVTIVLVSMYSSISVYKTKQNIEPYKETVITYKNLLTKEIQDDLIKKGLIYASASNSDEVYTVNMSFKDGSSKTLEITRKKAADAFEGDYTNSFVYLGDMNRDGKLEENDRLAVENCVKFSSTCDANELTIADVNDDNLYNDTDYGSAFFEQQTLLNNGLIPKSKEITAAGSSLKNDMFNIKYGDTGSPEDYTNYPFPDLGSSKNDYGNTVYDLRINNVEISTKNNILTIYIGFYHPELLTRYAIDIVCPINYS